MRLISHEELWVCGRDGHDDCVWKHMSYAIKNYPFPLIAGTSDDFIHVDQGTHVALSYCINIMEEHFPYCPKCRQAVELLKVRPSGGLLLADITKHDPGRSEGAYIVVNIKTGFDLKPIAELHLGLDDTFRELGRDMLTAKATMKRKDVLTPWVAARRGFSGTDWAESWLCLLAAFGMPGPDFVLLEPTGLESFAQKPASYSKVIIHMRVCLIRCGLSASEAIMFTLHGWPER